MSFMAFKVSKMKFSLIVFIGFVGLSTVSVSFGRDICGDFMCFVDQFCCFKESLSFFQCTSFSKKLKSSESLEKA